MIVETDLPARLDRLRWSRFHWLVVFALGITWILDGLEVTLAGAVSSALQASPSLHLSDTQVGASASAYLDHWGRRPMITATYAMSGALLGVTALLFVGGTLTATTMTIAFAVVFFFASPAASAAYLTVSECFPLEVRALAIAVFYAFGTALGGVAAPWIFGSLIGSGDPDSVAWGYAFAAALMLVAALVALWLGVPAERRSLEEVARPLSSS